MERLRLRSTSLRRGPTSSRVRLAGTIFIGTLALIAFSIKTSPRPLVATPKLNGVASASLRSSRVMGTACRAKEASTLSVLKGLAGAVAASFVISTSPSYAAIVKSAPVLAPSLSTPSEVVMEMDEQHGQSEIMNRIGAWDTDKNGRISRQEFEAGMQDYVPHELSPGQLDQAWNRIQGVEVERRASDPSYAGNKLTDEQKQMAQPGQPVALPTDRVESSIPKNDGTFYKYPSPQQAYNAMVRKGKDPDIYRAKDFVSTHNEMNERGWNEVLRYEKITHPECPKEKIKLAKFNGDYGARVDGSFDRHYWTVNRCGVEQKYVLDYFDTKKFDEITMPYSNDDIEIRVRPDTEDNSPNAKSDLAKHKAVTGKIEGSTADPN